MDASQPLLFLQSCLENEVVVYAKGLKILSGSLTAFDQHLNLVLTNAKETAPSENTRHFEILFVRGDSVILVTNEVRN